MKIVDGGDIVMFAVQKKLKFIKNAINGHSTKNPKGY